MHADYKTGTCYCCNKQTDFLVDCYYSRFPQELNVCIDCTLNELEATPDESYLEEEGEELRWTVRFFREYLDFVIMDQPYYFLKYFALDNRFEKLWAKLPQPVPDTEPDIVTPIKQETYTQETFF